MKSDGKEESGTKKALLCLWLMLLLVVSSGTEETRVERDSCDCEFSQAWDQGKSCVKHGTCNAPCRSEGYDNGSCQGFILCYCCRNCDG